MRETFIIQLPSDSAAQLASLQREIRGLDGVADTSSTTRSIDPVSATGWVQLASASLAAAGGAVVLVQKIIDAIKRRNIQGATLKFDGVELRVDGASIEDVERLVEALRRTGARK
jgi:hypothetical protein